MALALVAASLAVGGVARRSDVAVAQTITEMSTAATETGPATTRFPESTRRVWVRFAYANAGNTTFELTLSSPSGVPMYAHREAFDGAGAVAWEVTGDAVARGLAARATEAAATAADYAQRAATQPRGVAEFLATTAYAVSQVETSLQLIARLPMDEASRAHRHGAAASVAEVRHLLTQANRLPAGDDAGRQALAARMVEPANAALDQSAALESAVATMEGLPLPPTRSAAGERDAHTAAVRINGSPAQTRSFWVFDGTAFLPAVTRNAVAVGSAVRVR
jgi:hypothetical protein